MGLSSTAVITHVSPRNASTASSVSRVPPSWLRATRTSAPGALPRTTSSACAAGPQARAAWNDVPHPVKSTRLPSGSRRSPTRSGTWRSHSGWSAIDFLVRSPGTRPVYTIVRMSVFEKTTLGNGIRVITAPMPQVGSVACFITLAAGSRYETPQSKGIAHFAEHMFFKGTENRPTARSISTEIDAIGGEFNAFTGKELTGYYVRCGTETRDVALDVLTDMLRNSLFDAEEIEKEKGVILEEMNVYLDTPQRYVGNVYDRLLYADQPLGWDILGTRETIEGATRDTFTSYLDAWYRPRAHRGRDRRPAGRGPHRPPRGAAGRHRGRETGHAPPVELPPDGSPVLLHTKESEQAHLVLGVRGYPTRPPKRYALQLLSVVLGGGMSSRLFTEVRERRGLSYYVHAANAAYTDAGTLYTGAGVDVNRIDEALTTIIGELRKIAAEPVPADEFEKARGFAKGRFVLRLESPQGMIQFGLRREVLEGELEEPDKLLRELDAVTAEDVQDVARELLEDKRLYLAVVGPFDDPARFGCSPREPGRARWSQTFRYSEGGLRCTRRGWPDPLVTARTSLRSGAARGPRAARGVPCLAGRPRHLIARCPTVACSRAKDVGAVVPSSTPYRRCRRSLPAFRVSELSSAAESWARLEVARRGVNASGGDVDRAGDKGVSYRRVCAQCNGAVPSAAGSHRTLVLRRPRRRREASAPPLVEVRPRCVVSRTPGRRRSRRALRALPQAPRDAPRRRLPPDRPGAGRTCSRSSPSTSSTRERRLTRVSDERELLRRTAEIAADFLDTLDDAPVFARDDRTSSGRRSASPLPDGRRIPRRSSRRSRTTSSGCRRDSERALLRVRHRRSPAGRARRGLAHLDLGPERRPRRVRPVGRGGRGGRGRVAQGSARDPGDRVVRLRHRLPDGARDLPRRGAARGPRRVDWDVEERGLAGSPPITVVAGRKRHVTIDRALRLLGLGSADRPRGRGRQGRMRADALEAALRASTGPTIVCAQAGEVNTGAFDPFDEIVAIVPGRRRVAARRRRVRAVGAASPELATSSPVSKARTRGRPTRTSG